MDLKIVLDKENENIHYFTVEEETKMSLQGDFVVRNVVSVDVNYYSSIIPLDEDSPIPTDVSNYIELTPHDYNIFKGELIEHGVGHLSKYYEGDILTPLSYKGGVGGRFDREVFIAARVPSDTRDKTFYTFLKGISRYIAGSMSSATIPLNHYAPITKENLLLFYNQIKEKGSMESLFIKTNGEVVESKITFGDKPFELEIHSKKGNHLVASSDSFSSFYYIVYGIRSNMFDGVLEDQIKILENFKNNNSTPLDLFDNVDSVRDRIFKELDKAGYSSPESSSRTVNRWGVDSYLSLDSQINRLADLVRSNSYPNKVLNTTLEDMILYPLGIKGNEYYTREGDTDQIYFAGEAQIKYGIYTALLRGRYASTYLTLDALSTCGLTKVEKSEYKKTAKRQFTEVLIPFVLSSESYSPPISYFKCNEGIFSIKRKGRELLLRLYDGDLKFQKSFSIGFANLRPNSGDVDLLYTEIVETIGSEPTLLDPEEYASVLTFASLSSILSTVTDRTERGKHKTDVPKSFNYYSSSEITVNRGEHGLIFGLKENSAFGKDPYENVIYSLDLASFSELYKGKTPKLEQPKSTEEDGSISVLDGPHSDSFIEPYFDNNIVLQIQLSKKNVKEVPAC